MKVFIKYLLFSSISFNSFGQQYNDTLQQLAIQKLYQDGVMYKDGNGVKQDFLKAYNNFTLAAVQGDAQSIYAAGYLLYKGLGCTQDYKKAAMMFAKGALLGKDNSMYFLGLCYKNGYGVTLNYDSANYWLRRSDTLGYLQAKAELKLLKGENGNDSIKTLVAHIKNITINSITPLNKYSLVKHTVPNPDFIQGDYTGFLIQYDWSGEHVVDVKSLSLLLFKRERNENISGRWVVQGNDTTNITGVLSLNSLKFHKTSYKRKDYYNYDSSGIEYNFEDAYLNVVQGLDSLFLSGSIKMFSPQRNEPSKPLQIVLKRPLNKRSPVTISVNPNPFISFLTVSIELQQSAFVDVILFSENGAIVYENPAGKLYAGIYKLPLKPQNLSPGIYILKVSYNNEFQTFKVIKQ